ncbi:SpoIIE family protein phosphatase [Cellvibrio sp. NN19]|uniref:SpoIIE family protein phosphatase n=1 Tax=Cellvibrio chitinivorans TaxID=3102792 RepID=UPI002B40A815|nr:SpoIIE family protein phosphatase [Cellvibrio sp. NN19]
MQMMQIPSVSYRPAMQQPLAQDLCVEVPSVSAEDSNEQVFDVFTKHRDLMSLPVTEDGKPIGLISRSIFLSQMSKPFHRELYGRKSCIAFMDKEPLVVDAGMDIEALTFKTVEYGEKALADGFIITRDGRFAGIGHGLQLMRVVADMQAARNRQVTHSIEYASVIQRSMLRTSRETLQAILPDADLVWEPRDIVGGDFYHFAAQPNGWFGAVADCTGHGVPGAFMTLIASSSLAQAIDQLGSHNPSQLLGNVNRSIKQMLGQIDGVDSTPESDDGMDAAFFWYNAAERQLQFAGAKSSLFVLHPGAEGVEMIDGDRKGVGYVNSPMDFTWLNRSVSLHNGSLVFVTTDGLIDQIGGPKAIAFGKRRIRELLLAHRHSSTSDINKAMLDAFGEWQGQHRRRDDLTFFCFRIQEAQ